MRRCKDGLLVASLLCTLGGCTAGPVPVVDLNQTASHQQRPSNANRSVHIVTRGDSLHAIAWQYGLNYRRLAAANGIGPPYVIHPGQRLNLRAQAPAARAAATMALPRSAAGSNVTSAAWHWPAEGTVVTRKGGFGRKKGIDINGRPGQAVFPAKNGRVVYAGNGIRGYGNLLIVKHDAEYLSAYAYNRRVFVAEGDEVKVGQKIAEIGTNGSAQEAKLHFEIRRAGKAVDPLSLLPKRQHKAKI